MNDNTQPATKIVLVILVVLLISLWYGYSKNLIGENGDKTEDDKSVVTPMVTKTEKGELPKNFPSEIKLNGSTNILNAYDALYPGFDTKQGTVTFNSSKTPRANYDYYEKWAKDNVWQVINSIKEGNILALYLRKENEVINITIKDSAVNIGYAKLGQ